MSLRSTTARALAPVLLLAGSACQIAPPHVASTILTADKSLYAAETAYAAAASGLEAAVDRGLIEGGTAANVARLLGQAHDALAAARGAAATGDAGTAEAKALAVVALAGAVAKLLPGGQA